MKSLFEDELSERRISITVEQDECTAEASKAFDVEFDGTSVFERWPMPDVAKDFKLGAIVGPSGTGKSLLLREFGEEESVNWNPSKAIVSQFGSKERAFNRLTAVGLNSIPSWMRPHHVLSNGEQYRAYLARALKSGCVIDEFTSVVDRNVAKAMAVGVKRLIDKESMSRVVVATCHYDVMEWLCPDWVFDTATGRLARGCLRRPNLEISIHEASVEVWPLFSPYHYLTAKIHKSAECFVATLDGKMIAFSSILAMPSGTVQNAYRGHRTVVLPDYQGLGIGARLVDEVGEILRLRGKLYYSRSMHPRMGEYRERSPKWKATSSNKKPMTKNGGALSGSHKIDETRIAYSHVYVGEQSDEV